MIRKIILYLSLFVFVIFIFFSCKKETSCKDCKSNNKPPIAIGGPDQVINLPIDSVSLDGKNSSDPDGTIITYQWIKISGPASFSIRNASTATTVVKNLTEGVYQFELKVTDNNGLIGKDTTQVTVNTMLQPSAEIILDDLEWYYWHDDNDPFHLFDEIYLSIHDTANLFTNLLINVFVKPDSAINWVFVNPRNNGNCSNPYYYWLGATAINTKILFIENCLLNHSLIGKRASLKIIF